MSSTQLSSQESASRPSVIPCFLRGFFENPLQVASFVPSSVYLQRKLSSLACLQTARCVVELGPGTGETTRALLEAMPADSQLLCVEVVSEFVARLQEFADPRVTVVENSALALKSEEVSRPRGDCLRCSLFGDDSRRRSSADSDHLSGTGPGWRIRHVPVSQQCL